MRKLRGGRGTFTPLQGRSPDLKFVGAKFFGVFIKVKETRRGKGHVQTPSGAEPRFKMSGGKIFGGVFIKVEETKRGNGYVYNPFRGGAQI